MCAKSALTIYVSLFLSGGFLATAANGDSWKETHLKALAALAARQTETAEALLRQCVDKARRQDEVGVSANDLGVVLHQLGRDSEAQLWLDKAINEWRAAGAGEAEARTAHSIASVQRALGNYARSESLLRESLALNTSNAETRALLWNLLGDLMREEGRLTEAREAVGATLRMPDLSWRITAEARATLSDVDRESANYEASVDGWNKVLAMSRENGDETMEGMSLRGLGETFLESGNTARADPILRKALAIFEANRNEYQTAATLSTLCELYVRDGKPARAEEAIRRAVDLDEKILGATHPQIAVLLQMRADAAARQGAMTRARIDLNRAWAIIAGRFGERSTMAGAFLGNRGVIEQRFGNTAGAMADYSQGLEILRKAGPEARGAAASVAERYAGILKSLHRKDQAKALLAEAKSFRQ